MRKLLLAGLATAALSGAALAHHSFAMFSMTQTASISGTVKQWQWTNPHSWLELNVTKPDGSVVDYSFESRSVYLLMQAGVSRHSFTVGQKVSVTYNPLRDGGNGGSLLSANDADGKPIIAGRPAPPPKQ